MWRNTLKQYNYDRKKVEKICKKFWKLNNNEINIKKLPELCDELKLYLLVVNDKADFSMKFNDIVYQKGTIIYFIEKVLGLFSLGRVITILVPNLSEPLGAIETLTSHLIEPSSIFASLTPM